MLKAIAQSVDAVLSRFRPEALLASSFAIMILLGAGFLRLPISHYGDISFLDALFTSVSALCVTGLTVVDIGSAYTFTGQMIIVLLIQLGGIGIMTFAAVAFHLLGVRLSLRTQEAVGTTILQSDFASKFRPALGRVVKIILSIEGVGALVLFLALVTHEKLVHAVWLSVFHAISAFCNAGLSLYPNNLVGVKHNYVFIWTVSLLIIIGGIGHPVLLNIGQLFKKRSGGENLMRLTLHSLLAIATTVILLVAGTLLLYAYGMPGPNSDIDMFTDALFQSVTARTAGFNTVDIGGLSHGTLFVLIILMYIGGSPGSCAGGIKTTTFALWISQVWTWMHKGYSTHLLGRYVPQEIVRRATTIIGVSIGWNVTGMLLLLCTESVTPSIRFEDILFEQISAFGTVGLSTGITTSLSTVGKIWIMLTMYVGRIGPLTIIVLMLKKKPKVLYPEGRIMVG